MTAPDPLPLDCRAFRARLILAWDDPVPPADAHTLSCVGCQRYLALAQRTQAAVPRIRVPAVSADLTDRIVRAARRDARQRRVVRSSLLALAAAFVAALGLWLLQPPPQQVTVVVRQIPLQDNPVEWRASLREAGSAMLELTQRTAADTVDRTRELLPAPALLEPLDTLGFDADLTAATRSLTVLPQGLVDGFEPLTRSARRAATLFLRDLPGEPTKRMDY